MKDTRASLISACVFSALIFFVWVGAARAQSPSPTPAGDVYVLEPEGSVGTKYENRIEMQGMLPVKWEVVKGNLPEGIVLVPTNGTLFGWPSGPAKSYEFTIKVTDSAGKEALYQLEWAINAATPGPLLRKKGEPRAQGAGGSGGSSAPRGGGGAGGGGGGAGEKAAAKPTIDRPVTEDVKEISGFMPVKGAKSVTLELYPATAEKAEPPAQTLSLRPATVGADGRFTVKLDKRLARGQKMRVRVEPADEKAANIFSDPVVVERETAVLTPLHEGTKEIKGIADKGAKQVYAELVDAEGQKKPLGVGTVNAETGAFTIPLEKALTRQDEVFVYREGTTSRKVEISRTTPPTLNPLLVEGARTVSGYSQDRSAKVIVEVLPDAESNDPVYRASPDTVDPETGEFSVPVVAGLVAGQRVRAKLENTDAWSPERPVEAIADWGRVRGYFGVGMMLSNGGGEDFKRRDLYLNFNLDSNWYHRPRYSEVLKEEDQKLLLSGVLLRFTADTPDADGKTEAAKSEKAAAEAVAINTEREKLKEAFDVLERFKSLSDAERMAARRDLIIAALTRLQGNATLSADRRVLIRQIVDKLARHGEGHWDIHFNTFFDARLTPVPVEGQSTAGNAAGTDDFGNFIANKKGVLMQVGAYAPIFDHKRMVWNYQGNKNALFFGPLARAGVQTLFDRRGLADASVFADNDLFNFFALGARFGHYKLSGSDDRAPRLISYLDIARGRWQNLERRVPTGDRDPNGGEIFVRKRPWRWALEGRLKIPSLPFQIGFDSNIGEGPDDMRFLIGTNFDIDNLFRYLRR